MQPNLTIFANFYIDNEERLTRMKDSLQSMKSITVDKYVVNVRGSFSHEAVEYLNQNINSLSIFSIESEAGWFHDTSSLLPLIRTSYVLLWIEDHICMMPEKINDIVNKMEKCNADLLTYSFWQMGKFLQRYSEVDQVDAGEIKWFDHTVEVNSKFYNKSYLISYASIIRKELFDKIITDWSGEQRWSKMTPFDFEKEPTDTKWLPLRRANPKYELFASIDDDHGVIGSSLQSRGLYPKRTNRQSYATDSLSSFISRRSRILGRFRKFLSFIKT
jgi:hypothetical protein